MKITYQPIGIIHTPFTDLIGMPIQPSAAEGICGQIELYPEYVDGLRDLDGFSHIILLYHFHEVKEAKLVVTPFLDHQPRGVFSTRAPKRPNPIGLSIVKLLRIEENFLEIKNVDILDGTPLLDIKPCVPEMDQPKIERIGWLEQAIGQVKDKRSDDRFVDN